MKYQSIKHKSASPLPLSRVLNLLQQDICLPAAVLKQQAIVHNLNWMQSFANQSKVLLAPHGKTSMTPWLFQQQLAAGAWGLTVATAYQAQTAADAGARHIILANQLVGKANMALIAKLLQDGTEVYVCVDHQAQVQALSDFFRPLQLNIAVLIELGVNGGRCGCRTEADVITLAYQINSLPAVQLAGIEFYEGVVKGPEPEQGVRHLVRQAASLMHNFADLQLLRYPTQLISGAGSVWYDVVAEELSAAALPEQVKLVLRPGCYISHDEGIYQQAQKQVLARSALACSLGEDLQNALELAVYVQSLPEPGLAVLGFGKRDAAFDAGLPQATALYRYGLLLTNQLQNCETIKVMDQHAFWSYDERVQPQIGDIVLLSTSHPCLTFDKWRTLWVVDENYNLLQEVDTYF
ncbi:amino acid deaminase [Rheinheimera sp. 1928-s]|uniref:amino acid deaminase n=1 Tax=Rheinheimera sp. 1928-s TaxID=3033803 RepID=UPI0026240119|nr:amino acid deaminase [Rheinheimera sp. 1928-s]MDF3126005.1 amino acid deaminase [Rheinheimera sp. 1928-s]